MHPNRTRRILVALLGRLLSGCGATAARVDITALPATERVTPTASGPATQAPTTQSTAPPAPTSTLAPTAAPAPTPTLAPTPTPAPVIVQTLYLCKFGFCRYTLGDQEAEELITALNPGLRG